MEPNCLVLAGREKSKEKRKKTVTQDSLHVIRVRRDDTWNFRDKEESSRFRIGREGTTEENKEKEKGRHQQIRICCWSYELLGALP